jgi:hypothetical protein
VVTVTGLEEVVFDWTTDRCNDLDIPDLPARAFRDANDTVHLIATHYTALASTGPTLGSVERNCEPVFESAFQDDPGRFSDYEWIAATWSPDGKVVFALVHDEYHGWERGDCTPTTAFECWYNAVTLVVSTDGGSTFGYAAPPPDHLVAALPHQYIPETAAVGLFSPSSIVTGPDGAWYALVKVGAHLTGAQTVCLMRTTDLNDPAAWRFWDGNAFDGSFVDPYGATGFEPEAHTCPALAWDEIGAQMVESLTWNTALERYLLVGLSADMIEGREVWGFYYSTSVDLILWTRRELLLEVPLPWTVASAGNDLSYLNPSLLDPDSAGYSFEYSDESAYLYFTRNNAGQGSLDRDLIRVQVTISLKP